MIELPDDELDKLFRKSSEELDPHFDPNDWNDLKKRLDDADGIRPAGWLRRWWPVGILLLFLAGGLVTYFVSDLSKIKGGDSIISVKRDVRADLRREKRIVGIGLEKPAIDKGPGKKTEEISKQISEDRKNLTKSKSEKILPLSQAKAGGVYLEPNRSSGKGGEGAFSSIGQKRVSKSDRGKDESKGLSLTDENVVLPKPEAVDWKSLKPLDNNIAADKRVFSGGPNGATNKSLGVVNQPLINYNIVSPKSGVTGKLNGELTFENNHLRDEIPSEATQTGLDKETSNIVTEILVPHPFDRRLGLALPAIIEAPETKEKTQPVPPMEPTPNFAVRFSYSPDLTAVGLKDFSKPGAAFSMLGEFALLRRLYFQTGVVRTVKEYGAYGPDYTFPKYVTDINTPSHVDGICKMLEIPVGLRYDIASSRQSRWFAGTGLSSYFMLNEKYKYTYAKYVHLQKSGWEGKTGWYFFSHINASAGYEYRVSKKLSLTAEPYLRIPIKEVGYGKVKLFTTGIWISLRYTPVFR